MKGAWAKSEFQHDVEFQQQIVKWGSSPLRSPIRLDLNQATYSYGAEFTLQIDAFEALPNERLVIIGPSGQGKTTLLGVLAGLYDPLTGTIVVNGKERNTVDESSWWDQTTYISQHPYLFSGTIRENIEMGTVSSDDELKHAIEASGLTELISTLPQGWSTTVGEGGRGLSGGEKQRIALARSFLKKPALVFYDEPTIGLDVKTERILSQSMESLSETATVITVAHRLPTIRKADKIAVLEDGRLVAFGPPEHVIRENAYAASLLEGGDDV